MAHHLLPAISMVLMCIIASASSAAALPADGDYSRRRLLQSRAHAPTLEERRYFKAEDYARDYRNLSSTTSPFGSVTPLDVRNMPALEGHGLAQASFQIQPCAFNEIHEHPRGTEILHLFKGGPLHVEFTEENGGRSLQNVIYPGSTTFFPEGLFHFQQNIGCKEAANFLASLNHIDPGVVTVLPRLLTFSDNTLASTFGVPVAGIEALRRYKSEVELPHGEYTHDGKCLDRCGFVRHGWLLPHYPFFPVPNVDCQVALSKACVANFGEEYHYALFANDGDEWESLSPKGARRRSGEGKWGCYSGHRLMDVRRGGDNYGGSRQFIKKGAHEVLSSVFNNYEKCQVYSHRIYDKKKCETPPFHRDARTNGHNYEYGDGTWAYGDEERCFCVDGSWKDCQPLKTGSMPWDAFKP